MGLFNRFFKNVEEVNKGEGPVEELGEELFVGTTKDEANDYWVSMAQNIIINTMRATDGEAERAFVVIDMREEPAFEIFYQFDGQLSKWQDVKDEELKTKLLTQLLPQAPEVAAAVNEQFRDANHPKISFAELQFETATSAWFSHIIWEDSEDASVSKEEVVEKWFNILEDEVKNMPLDSDRKLSWYL